MNRKLRILLLTSTIFTLAGGLFSPIYAVFVEQIGGDLITAGIAYSIFSIIAGVVMFFLSKMEDRIDNKEGLVILGYALGAVGFLGYIFVSKPVHLFIVQMVFGIAMAIGQPVYDGLYSRHLDKGKYVSEWGTVESMYWIITGIAAIAGGIVAESLGFRTLFIIMFGLSLMGTVLSIMLMRK